MDASGTDPEAGETGNGSRGFWECSTTNKIQNAVLKPDLSCIKRCDQAEKHAYPCVLNVKNQRKTTINRLFFPYLYIERERTFETLHYETEWIQ